MEFRAKQCILMKINALQHRRAHSLPPSPRNQCWNGQSPRRTRCALVDSNIDFGGRGGGRMVYDPDPWTPILGDVLDFDVHRTISVSESSKSVHGNIGYRGMSLLELQGFIFQIPYTRIFELRRGQNLGCFQMFCFESNKIRCLRTVDHFLQLFLSLLLPPVILRVLLEGAEGRNNFAFKFCVS